MILPDDRMNGAKSGLNQINLRPSYDIKPKQQLNTYRQYYKKVKPGLCHQAQKRIQLLGTAYYNVD